jgi:hypothetical protein
LVEEELLTDLAVGSVDNAEQIQEIDIVQSLCRQPVISVTSGLSSVFIYCFKVKRTGLWLTPAASDLFNDLSLSFPRGVDGICDHKHNDKGTT